jgi:hypothetical protein
MDLNEVFNEMIEIAKKIGITVRKENGKFKGGTCIINEEEVILINNSIPIESKTRMLANCLSNYKIEDVFMKPMVRDYIENEQFERENQNPLNDFKVIIEN